MQNVIDRSLHLKVHVDIIIQLRFNDFQSLCNRTHIVIVIMKSSNIRITVRHPSCWETYFVQQQHYGVSFVFEIFLNHWLQEDVAVTLKYMCIIVKFIIWISSLRSHCVNWFPLNDIEPNEKSTLVQVMAWCRQATSHYLSQCWPRSMSPCCVTRPQGVVHFISNSHYKDTKTNPKTAFFFAVGGHQRSPWAHRAGGLCE